MLLAAREANEFAGALTFEAFACNRMARLHAPWSPSLPQDIQKK